MPRSPLTTAVLLMAAASAQAQAPASFPGAEGFGATATGGRGGQVLYVTTTASSVALPIET